MNTVRVHGILLVVAMLVALETWTRDDNAGAAERTGMVSLWEESVEQVSSVRYETPARTLLLEYRLETDDAADEEHRYLWGIATPKTSAVDTASAGTGPRNEEFAVGDEGEELLQRLAALRALRDLGELDDDAKEEYELVEPERSLTITLASGQEELLLGGTVFGGPHRYALDPETGRGYVISNEMLRGLEGGAATLQSRDLHRYDNTAVATVTVRTPTGERQMLQQMDGPFSVWSSPDNPAEGDQTFANFMERVQQLSILTYESGINVDTLQFVVRIDFTGEGESPLGYLEMYRGPADAEGISEYYVKTEVTRVPARAYRSFAERVDQDLADIF